MSRMLLLCAVASLGGSLSGCDQHVAVGGVVKDEAGAPIGGANVTLQLDPAVRPDYMPSRMTTLDDGYMLVTTTYAPGKPADATLTVEADSYQRYERRLPNGIHNLTITLKKKPQLPEAKP